MSVKVTKLPNGLRVATDHIPHIQTVSIGAWVGSGTRHETAEVNGIAHLLEHMAFKGTERRSAYQIAEEIEAVGGSLNAYTSRESTAYYAKVMSDDAALAFDIISDILQNPKFDEVELQRERAVVLQEIGEAWDAPDDIVFDHFQEVAFPGQGLGRPILGKADIVRGLGAGVLRNFMDCSYGLDRVVFAAAGNLDHDDLVAWAEEAFSEKRNGPAPQPEKAAYTGGDLREGRDTEQVHLVLGFDGVGFLDPDYYACHLLSTLFGGGMSSRLFQQVREERGLVYSIHSFSSSYSDSGLFGVYAGTGRQEVAEVIPVLCDELNKLHGGVGERELEIAKNQLRASLLMSRESSSNRCEQLAQQLLTHGRVLPSAEVLGKMNSVTTDDLQRVIERLLSKRPTMASVGQIGSVESFDQIERRLA
ncbi:MAG: pitrilysin family protein [Pseudomonadota bacterium]